MSNSGTVLSQDCGRILEPFAFPREIAPCRVDDILSLTQPGLSPGNCAMWSRRQIVSYATWFSTATLGILVYRMRPSQLVCESLVEMMEGIAPPDLEPGECNT
jgi:hypothetical protein